MIELLKKLGIELKNDVLIKQALTHTSFANENNVESYERLEFLGDAVLESIISDYLFTNTALREGEMTKTRAAYVCEQALAFYAKKIGIVPFILVGKGQINNVNDTIIADVFESIIACIYLELGYETAKRYVLKTVIPYVKEHIHFFDDYKSILQELVQTNKKTLNYEVINESGPAHEKKYDVVVKVDGLIFGKGSGKSKKDAEQNAAKDAINKQAS